MDTQQVLLSVEYLQLGFQRRLANVHDLESMAQAIAVTFMQFTGSQPDILDNVRREWQEPGCSLKVASQSLTGAARLYERAGMRSDPTRQFVVYEKGLHPGLEVGTPALKDAGP